MFMFAFKGLEMCFPLQRPGTLQGANARNWAKLHATRRKTTPKIQHLWLLPQCWGQTGGGEFCKFSPCCGEFRLGGFLGPLRGKNSQFKGIFQGLVKKTHSSDLTHTRWEDGRILFASWLNSFGQFHKVVCFRGEFDPAILWYVPPSDVHQVTKMKMSMRLGDRRGALWIYEFFACKLCELKHN